MRGGVISQLISSHGSHSVPLIAQIIVLTVKHYGILVPFLFAFPVPHSTAYLSILLLYLPLYLCTALYQRNLFPRKGEGERDSVHLAHASAIFIFVWKST